MDVTVDNNVPIILTKEELDIMYQVSIEGKDAVYPYVRQPTFGRRIIILAQYCVSREPRTGSTETAILKGIEDNGYYDDDAVAWVDLVQLSSKTTNAVIDQNVLTKISKNRTLVVRYIERLSKHLEMHDKSSIPLVYIAGKPPAFAFSIAQNMDMIEKIKDLSLYQRILCDGGTKPPFGTLLLH